jgi:CHASE3 domain sensor protein
LIRLNEFARKIVPLMLLVIILMLTNVSLSYTQTPDVSTLSYRAFDQLAAVYTSGGTAPGLVSRLNSALSLIEAARIERAQGNASNASALEDQARSIIEQLSNQIPAAQQQAVQESNLRVEIILAGAVFVVGLLTFCFYGGVRVWRWYEMEKLLEMRILGEETKD